MVFLIEFSLALIRRGLGLGWGERFMNFLNKIFSSKKVLVIFTAFVVALFFGSCSIPFPAETSWIVNPKISDLGSCCCWIYWFTWKFFWFSFYLSSLSRIAAESCEGNIPRSEAFAAPWWTFGDYGYESRVGNLRTNGTIYLDVAQEYRTISRSIFYPRYSPMFFQAVPTYETFALPFEGLITTNGLCRF